ncbi:cytochrome c oxidase subunit II [Sporichthya brevicatena]|uniref:cytochrome-c oxidase n=1 Tax=Sporichthya brevicatena TaxID=171442 RepID=A0ABN1H681_9ACTN
MLALVLLTCTGCNTEDLPNLAYPDPATEEGPRMLLLWQGSWLAAILTGAVVWGLILWACIFHRKKHANDIPIQTRYNLPIEALYTILPFVMVVVLFYFTERDQSIILDEDRQEDLTVNVVGRQWSWSFNYVDENVYEAGTPGKEPELVLPINKLVRFEVTAADVIHSFWVPNFLFKIDAMPGRVNSFEATPNKLGTFSGKCAELCGRDHARMFFTVRVVTEAEYAAHIAELRKNGQEGQLPRGILDTKEDRERAYNLKGSYATESDHSTPATQPATNTEPAQGEGQANGDEGEENTDSEPANDAPATSSPASGEAAGNNAEGTS